MTVAVDTRFLPDKSPENYGSFTKEVFSRLPQQLPQHRFYFLFDRPYPPHYIFPGNVTPVVLAPAARHPLLWKYWYDIKVPLILKRIKADVFVSPDGFCSLTTKVPQCLVVQDLGFLHCPETYKKSHLLFYKRYTSRFLNKAKRIATVSLFSKNEIAQKYGVAAGKIDVVYSAAKEVFQPVPSEQQWYIKEKYTHGKEYFIYTGAIHPCKNIIHLLKGFSVFKKRQRSTMKLVLAGSLLWKNKGFQELLQAYKYREDVVLTGPVEESEFASLTGSAYALVHPSFYEGFGVPVLEALQSAVPALTSLNTAMQDMGTTAALYFDAANPADIADKLMLIYKDENLRRKLIEEGKAVAQKYSWQHTTGLLWQCIEKAAGREVYSL